MRPFFSIAILAIMGIGLLLSSANERATVDSYQIGDKVEDFTLKTTEGNQISLSEYLSQEGRKGTILIFTCNTCPYAVAYEDRIIELHKKYADAGWPVLAINPNDPELKPGDSFGKMVERAHSKSFPYDYAFDESQEVFKKFGATKTPHVFVVDKNWKLRYMGGIDNNATDPEGVTTNYVEDAIAAIDQGKDPNPESTKAVGCSIKFKKGA